MILVIKELMMWCCISRWYFTSDTLICVHAVAFFLNQGYEQSSKQVGFFQDPKLVNIRQKQHKWRASPLCCRKKHLILSGPRSPGPVLPWSLGQVLRCQISGMWPCHALCSRAWEDGADNPGGCSPAPAATLWSVVGFCAAWALDVVISRALAGCSFWRFNSRELSSECTWR